MKTGKYTVGQLLTSSEIDQIIIPELQRDYVWDTINVGKLLASILQNYDKRERTQLEVIDKGSEKVQGNLLDYLSEQYVRMKFSTKIGFIYAYHSPEYAGKYFLIDGQQRITTIFLLLIATYKHLSDEKKKLFRTKYFNNDLPKVDYKVRETSHDFLVDFIEFELGNPEGDFADSHRYYDIYDKDVTVRHLFENYKFISEQLSQIDGIDFADFADYVENYIQFNYFDTNICQQGERLYLYMNSRGEGLSVHERLRPLIVSRQESNEKTKVGDAWEEWQNFFWEHKHKNYNADKGFQEFIKWTIVLHILHHNYAKSTTKASSYLKSDTNWEYLYQYCNENAALDFSWLQKVFDAVKKLESISSVEKDTSKKYIVKNWLSSKGENKNYITILPCIYFLIRFPDANEIDVKRIGMFFKNVITYDDTVSHDWDGTTIEAVKLVKAMADENISDIKDITTNNNIESELIKEADKYKSICYSQPNRDKWEDVFWNITNDDGYNKFLRGDISFFFKWKGTDNVEVFNQALGLFRDKIYLNCQYKSGTLISKIMRYGDFTLFDNGGSWNLHSYGDRYRFPLDAKDWYIAMNKKHELSNFITKYLDQAQYPEEEPELYRYFVSDNINIINDYMSSGRFLYYEVYDRIILLAARNAGENASRELMVHWLKKFIKDIMVTNYRTCIIRNKDCGCSIKIVYKHGALTYEDNEAHWSIFIRGMNGDVPIDISDIEIVNDPNQWTPDVDGWYNANVTCKDDFNKTIAERIDDLTQAVNDLFTQDVLIRK